MILTKEQILEGQVFLIDKPLEWTSFDVVNKLRYHLRKLYGMRKIKVGHAGTLDPLASGLLIICVGRKTKQINEYMGQPKTYTGTFKLGAITPSYDLETPVSKTFPTEHINDDLLEEARQKFLGNIMQEPPAFSAIKKGGVKAYDAARKGEALKLEPRSVQISEFALLRKEVPEIDFMVSCSKGTYIRSLAHDFGKAVNSGGYLAALRRTKIGPFRVEEALSVNQFLEELRCP